MSARSPRLELFALLLALCPLHSAVNLFRLKDFFLPAEVSEVADVGDDEGDFELVVGANLAKFEAAILEGEAAAAAVVADLDELILQGVVGDVVAHTRSDVEPLFCIAAVADQGANLI
jgi:hypothetical protein